MSHPITTADIYQKADKVAALRLAADDWPPAAEMIGVLADYIADTADDMDSAALAEIAMAFVEGYRYAAGSDAVLLGVTRAIRDARLQR